MARAVPLAFAVALVAVVPAFAAQQKLETLTVSPTLAGQSKVAGQTEYRAEQYRFVLSGTMTATKDDIVQQSDAFWCFDCGGSVPIRASNPPAIAYQYPGDTSVGGQPYEGNYPEYRPDHVYDVTYNVGSYQTGRWTWSARPHGPNDGFSYAGSFSVDVYGDPPDAGCEPVGSIEHVKPPYGTEPTATLTRRGKSMPAHPTLDLCVVDTLDSGNSTVEFYLVTGRGDAPNEIEPGTRIEISDEYVRHVLLFTGVYASKGGNSSGVQTQNATVTPTGPASRAAGAGAASFTVAYDRAKKTTTVVVNGGSVSVDPTGTGDTTIVAAGQAADVTGAGVKTIPANKAQARLKARDRVLARIGKAAGCALTVKNTSVAPAGKNWKVTVKSSLGKSVWRVKGKKVTPLNKGAKTIARNCR